MNAATRLPLEGLRVVELGRLIAAPWAAQMLADFGAEVIKVEDPRGGDPMRNTGPGFLRDGAGQPTQDGGKFSALNRNKRSITANIADPQGRDIVYSLLSQADVVIENFKVDDLARRGLDYERVRLQNAGVVYLSITGFGQTGPARGVGAIDPMIQAFSGFMSVNGEEGGPPLKSNVNIMDFTTGMFGAFAVLLALYERRETGRGRYIDLSMLDCGVSMMSYTMLASLASGRQLPRLGSSNFDWVPSGVFACADGLIYLAIGSDKDFASFCSVIGLPALAKDARYAQRAARNAEVEMLRGLTEQSLAGGSVERWVRDFHAAGLIAAPIHDFADIAQDAQVQARGLVKMRPHAAGAEIPLVRNPIRLSGLEELPLNAPPLLGQHTQEVLRERLGITASQIEALARSGAI
ncbi:CaiB/BaiF CoA transferase family protein [Ottowia sp. VDI28]|uniref:CaiB/BaiF CoA transferase family protein n=1 Tax=Ottowia sp. VDI28 TaxID=3133968 RepID=UPI003C2AD192